MNSNLVKSGLLSATILLPWWMYNGSTSPIFTLTVCLLVMILAEIHGSKIGISDRSGMMGFLVVVALASTWQWIYPYAKGNYVSDIFRGVYEKGLGPLYGKPLETLEFFEWKNLWFFVLILPVTQRKRLNNPWVFGVISTIILIGVSAQDGVHRISHWTSHIETFSEGLPLFTNGVNWNEYIDNMGTLGVHNDHYPPLPLSLLSVGSPLYTNLLLMTCALGASFAIKRQLGSMLGLGLPLLWLYTPFTWVPLYLLVGFLMVNLSRNLQKNTNLILLSLLWVFLSFLTYGTVLGLAIFSTTLLFLNGVKSTIRPLVIMVSAVILGVTLVSWLTGFNYVLGLQKAIKLNNELLDHPDYWASLTLGTFRSFGNLLAFAIILGPYTWGWLIKTSALHKKWIAIVFLILSFSGLFYMETERVWALYTPFLFLLPREVTISDNNTTKTGGPLYLWVAHWGYMAILLARVDLSFGAFY